VVTTLFDDLNRNDKDGASTLFVKQPSVTEAFSPFHWQGTTAFKDWMADLATYCKKHDDTDLNFTPAKPLSQGVDGDHGNVIVPVVLDLKESGKPLNYDGLVNVVLLKNRGTWKITAFTWTQK
jgi:hypothetical protein